MRPIDRLIRALVMAGTLSAASGAVTGPASSPPPAPKGHSLLPPPSAPFAKAYGLWKPMLPYDTAPLWLHESYWTYGPDGKVYNTWHDPQAVDPETGRLVNFGHEHGDDQTTSDLYAISGAIPFGYVNELFATCGCPVAGACNRHEDHVGHKVTVVNDQYLSKGGTIDMLFKLHQGSHSPDALTNPAHELVIFSKHDSGPLLVKWRTLHPFGHVNQFFDSAAGDQQLITLTSPVPSPLSQTYGSVLRIIPSLRSMREAQAGWGHLETWNGGPERWALVDLQRVVEFSHHIYFHIIDPSRYYSTTASNHIERTIDLCYDPASPLYNRVGQGGYGLATTFPNGAAVRALPGPHPISWNDPRSPFRGASRFLELDRINLKNLSGKSQVWTNAYGTEMRVDKSITEGVVVEQYLSVDMSGQDQGGSTQDSIKHGVTPMIDYSEGGTNGVHAPN
jgi:hypothetical protein